MRILIAHNYYQMPGGEDAVARSEAEMLKAFGEDVIVYHRHNTELNRLHLFQRLGHFARLGHNRSSYDQFRQLLRQRRPDVVHFHNIFYMMTPSVYRACRDEGVAVVQSLHNFRMMCSNALLFRQGRVCEECLERNIWQGVLHGCFHGSKAKTLAMAAMIDGRWRRQTWLKDVDLYIAAAKFTREKYIQRGVPAGKIKLKPHFIHPDPKPEPYVGDYALYLGRLSEEKGVNVLMEAWRPLKNHPLKIVGTGPLEGKMRSMAQNESMPHVEFAGFAGPDACLALLRRAKFLIIPSLCYENFPRVVVEAFALGIPILASRLGSLAELVEEGKTGLFFEPGDAGQLTRQVRYCFEHPQEMRMMGEHARITFEQRYTARQNYEQLMTIYHEAMALAKGVRHE